MTRKRQPEKSEPIGEIAAWVIFALIAFFAINGVFNELSESQPARQTAVQEQYFNGE